MAGYAAALLPGGTGARAVHAFVDEIQALAEEVIPVVRGPLSGLYAVAPPSTGSATPVM